MADMGGSPTDRLRDRHSTNQTFGSWLELAESGRFMLEESKVRSGPGLDAVATRDINASQDFNDVIPTLEKPPKGVVMVVEQ